MNAVKAESETQRLEALLRAVSQPGQSPLETAEAAELSLRQAFRLGNQDAKDQDTILSLLCQLDAWLALHGVTAFVEFPKLEKAYAKMAAETPEVFWTRAFPKLGEIRDARFAELYKEAHGQT